MKRSTISIFLATLAQITYANFDIYIIYLRSPYISGILTRYAIFAVDPDCDDVRAAHEYMSRNDVSGTKFGVRCEGNGCEGNHNPGDVKVMEMHFSNHPLYHWTIYSNSAYSLFGTDGKKYGDCIVFSGYSFRCATEGMETSGYRKFRCLTSFTPDQIQGGR
ncbi:hypothetical protein P280DRAFT_484274 [Massarina eburnea CBS 473.64]|uniref:Uncharacterized protein n=1 Tax=Massarina eburnea CBS 473.64 TaxID=1395130 RepID=A0A6A6RLC9_9PLEO|nr:hypothetical protein P280DRAFT_484274 [Massarina eburnea CBS 473.64]